MVKSKSTPPRLFLVLVFCISLQLNVRAQFESLLDSVENSSSLDRRRVFLGYRESKMSFLRQHNLAESYMNTFERFARSKGDRALMAEITYQREKYKKVYQKPESKWETELYRMIKTHGGRGELLYMGYCYHELAQIQFQKQKYVVAMINSIRSLDAFREIGYENVPSIGKVLHELALIHYFYKDYNEVIKLMWIANKHPAYTPGLDIQRYNNLGLAYRHLKVSDSSQYYFEKAYERAISHKSKVWKGLVLGNMANLHYDEGRFHEAYSHALGHYRNNFDEMEHSVIRISAYTLMAKVYTQLDSLPQAAVVLKVTEELLTAKDAQYLGDLQQLEKAVGNYYEVQMNYLRKIGDHRQASFYQDSLSDIRVSLNGKYNNALISVTVSEIAKTDKEDQLAAYSRESTQETLQYGIAIAGILVISAGLYYRTYRSKKRKELQSARLLERKSEIEFEKLETERELLAAKEELQQFVLTINSMNIPAAPRTARANYGVLSTPSCSVETAPALDKLKSSRILNADDWATFQSLFNKVFPEFRTRLLSRAPKITTSELRYLMLVHLEFSHKEMALSLGVSDSAIRVTWNRVRKRFDGTLEDTPASLLNLILAGNPDNHSC
jgi:tetratricopeptide (TPR) repeat protein